MNLIQVDRKYKNIIQDYKNEYLEHHDRISGDCGLHHYTILEEWFDELDKIKA